MLLSDDDIDVIMTMARELTGTKVDREKHSIIVHNVEARIIIVGASDLEAYLHYVDRHEAEMSFLLSALTIHTTSWFREVGAFEKLDSVLQERIKNKTQGVFRVLSVACSTGEEVYSLATVLEYHRISNPIFEYHIDGWDIDPICLKKARTGTYESDAAVGIPLKFQNFFMTHFSLVTDQIQVPEHIKDRCRFRAVNITSPPVEADKYDYVMCRNMLIYFEDSDVRKIVGYIQSRLEPHGLFCTGVSETIAVNGSIFSSVGNATYSMGKSNKASGPKHDSTKNLGVTSKVHSAKLLLIVDDDHDIRDLIGSFLKAKGYSVVDAANAHDAAKVIASRGDEIGLVLSDQRMPPGKTGLELCRDLRLAGFKAPFVIVSGFSDQQMALEAAQIGCNDVVLKPLLGSDLLRLVKSYLQPPVTKENLRKPSLVLFGASTGGTEVLAKMLGSLPSHCPPVVVVQHIAPDFAADFAKRLALLSGLKLGLSENNEVLSPGHLYMALGDYHVGVSEVGQTMKLVVSRDPPIASHRPSVDFLFSTAAKSKQSIFAALMTGMGRDGAEGLLKLKNQGATTFAQNEESCVVYGMPKEAVRLQAALHVASPMDIRGHLDLRLGVSSLNSRKVG